MQKRNALTVGADPRGLVHEPVPFGPASIEGSIEVGHLEADVVDPRTPFREKAGDGTVLGHRLQQLDLALAKRKRNDPGAVGLGEGNGFEAQHVTVKGDGGFEICHGNADMGD